MSFFVKMQSPDCPPELTFVLRGNFIKYYILSTYKASFYAIYRRKKYFASGNDFGNEYVQVIDAEIQKEQALKH